MTNKRFHTGLDDLYGRYEIMEDGKVLSSGNLDELQLDAQGSKVITIADPVLTKVPGAEYFIKFSFCQKKDTDWEKAGYEVASEQIKIAESEKPVFKAENGATSCTETEKGYLVKGDVRSHFLKRRRDRIFLCVGWSAFDKQRTGTERFPCTYG